MSKKIFRAVAVVASVVALVVPGLQAVGIAGISAATAASVAAVASLVAAGASLGSNLLAKKPTGFPAEAINRLNANLDPQAPRKIVIGDTAMATDIRYQAYTGPKQNYLNWIMAVASHQVEDIEEIWFDDYMAWSRAGGINSAKIDPWFLFIDARNVGVSGNGIAIDAAWSASASLTGCAYIFFRFLLTEKSKSQPSPFAQSVPTRITVRGKGMRVPDIRLPGVDPEDQSTWVYGTSGNNPALQMLAYLLGWKINGKLAVGKGVPVQRLDLDSFITAANFCDEPVTLAAGGTEPRYRSAGVVSEADTPTTVLSNLNAAMNGVLRDAGGKLALTVLHNDLAVPVASFTENDIIGEEHWKQTASLNETFNIVRGRFVDPSNFSLYQLKDYPEVAIDSPDDIDRIDPFELPMVQSASQAQRLAKQRLQRVQYAGTYSVTVNARGWQVNLGDVVTISHDYMGWESKLFRVAAHGVSVTGQVPMILVEEHPDIYQWDAEESPEVEVAEPTSYDPTLHPWALAFQKPTGGGAQLLWDDTFDPGWWDVPEPAERINWGSSRATWAVNIPFVSSTDLRVIYEAPSDYMPRTQPGQPIFVRIDAQPTGVEPEPLEFEGEPLEFEGEELTVAVESPADFDLQLAIDWLDVNGDFHSRTIIATLDPEDGEQTISGRANAPIRGYARFSIGYPSQTGKSGTWAVYEPWMAEYEPAADVTGDSIPTMIVAPATTIDVDYTGTATTVFPLYLVNSRTLGNADISSETDWVGTFPPGMTATMNNTPGSASRGTIEITGFSGTASTSIKVESTYGGLTKEDYIDIAVAVAAAPSGETGGGSGGTSTSDSTITTASSTSYGTANAGPLVAVAGSGGQVALTAPLTFSALLEGGEFNAAGKWQWRVIGGSWADVGSEILSEYGTFRDSDLDAGNYQRQSGYIAVNQTKTGLTNGTSYEFQLLLRSVEGPVLRFVGTAAAQGS